LFNCVKLINLYKTIIIKQLEKTYYQPSHKYSTQAFLQAYNWLCIEMISHTSILRHTIISKFKQLRNN